MDLIPHDEVMVTLTVDELGCTFSTFNNSFFFKSKVALKWKKLLKFICVNSGFILINVACI